MGYNSDKELNAKVAYHSTMLARHILAVCLLAVPTVLAQSLPELGEPAQSALTPLQERLDRLGPRTGASRWPAKVRAVPPGLRQLAPAIDPTVQKAVADALLADRQIQSLYSPGPHGEPKPYRLHPVGLLLRGGRLRLLLRGVRLGLLVARRRWRLLALERCRLLGLRLCLLFCCGAAALPEVEPAAAAARCVQHAHVEDHAGQHQPLRLGRVGPASELLGPALLRLAPLVGAASKNHDVLTQ